MRFFISSNDSLVTLLTGIAVQVTADLLKHELPTGRSLVVVAKDSDPFAAHPHAVAVLAKEHRVAEAFLHAGDLGREMEDAGGEEDFAGAPCFRFAAQCKTAVGAGDAVNLRLSNFVP